MECSHVQVHLQIKDRTYRMLYRFVIWVFTSQFVLTLQKSDHETLLLSKSPKHSSVFTMNAFDFICDKQEKFYAKEGHQNAVKTIFATFSADSELMTLN